MGEVDKLFKTDKSYDLPADPALRIIIKGNPTEIHHGMFNGQLPRRKRHIERMSLPNRSGYKINQAPRSE